MKKLLLLTLGLTFSFLSTETNALSFAEGTIFLDAETEVECQAQGGDFIEWYEEKYCTNSPRESEGIPQASSHFTDLDSTNPSFNAVNYIKEKNIINGYPDGSFKAENKINRAELTKIIIAMNYEAEMIQECDISKVGLSDVPADAWFAPYICTAKEKGVIKGYEDGTFRPANNINFAEASKIIGKAVRPSLSDGSDIWFRPYLEYFSTKNALPISVTSFEQLVNRGEVSEIIYRIKAEITNKPSLKYGEGTLSSPEIPAPKIEEAATTPIVPEETTELPTDSNAEYLPLTVEALQSTIGKKKMALFFHADWCPTCVKADASINASLNTFPQDVVIFKTNYDTETELKKKFNITQQHTVVIIDEKNQLKNTIPGFTIDQLREALK